jgi:hypothetical protein
LVLAPGVWRLASGVWHEKPMIKPLFQMMENSAQQ